MGREIAIRLASPVLFVGATVGVIVLTGAGEVVSAALGVAAGLSSFLVGEIIIDKVRTNEGSKND